MHSASYKCGKYIHAIIYTVLAIDMQYTEALMYSECLDTFYTILQKKSGTQSRGHSIAVKVLGIRSYIMLEQFMEQLVAKRIRNNSRIIGSSSRIII